MTKPMRDCLDCAALGLERSPDGTTIYWCRRRRKKLGQFSLEGRCPNFKPWRLPGRGEEEA